MVQGFFLFFFFNKEAYYTPLIKVYTLALEIAIKGFYTPRVL